MRIGRLAERPGVSERALRYAGEQGLLTPARTPGRYRDYTEADLQTVRRIRTRLSAGLGTTLIAEVLPCMLDSGDVLAVACDDLLPDLVAERDRIDASIA